MKTFHFKFADGTWMSGDGEGPAQALMDAYRKNGYLPFSDIISIDEPGITCAAGPDPLETPTPGQVIESPKRKARK